MLHKISQSWLITRRELKAYFDGLTGYVVLGFFLLITGWFFGNGLFLNNIASVQQVFDMTPLLFMFFVPALTMGAFAEERRSGTLELLLTMPIRDWQVILAKLLTATVLCLIAISLTLLYVLIVSALGNMDAGATTAGYIGMALYGLLCSAIGIYASSLTRNQIVAYLLGFVILLALFLLDKSAPLLPAWLGTIVEYLGADYHYNNLLRGVLDTRDLLYYISLILFFGLLTAHNIGKRDA